MKRASKKILSLALAMAMVLGMFTLAPISASAATAQSIPSGAAVTINIAGLYNIATADNGATITVATNSVALTGTHANLSVVISAGIILTLKDAHISRTGDGNPIQAGGTNCGLILVGDNSVTATSDSAGVNVPDTASLTIVGPGKLTAQGGRFGAGIGGNDSQSSGAITIRHATVAAYGGVYGGAGIGGGTDGNGNAITIVNSSVTATGSNGDTGAVGGGAGIGGGAGSSGSTGGSGTNISITGSAVVATGGAGIGGGGGRGGTSGSTVGGNGNTITIDATSTVQAIGGAGGSALNGGGGGGGAAIGGGGGAGGNNNTTGKPGGTGTGIVVGNTLAAGSKGGTGNTPSGTGSKGGDGALGGGGGNGGNSSAQGGAPGTSGTELGSVTVGGTMVDLTSRPDLNYTGFPALPTVTNPSNQTVTEGGTTNFTVTPGGGTGPYFYQWQINSGAWMDITNGGVYSGATTATLTLTNVPLANSGAQYRCVVNDSVWREAASGTATLTVNAADTTAPTIVSVVPSGQNEDLDGSVIVTFSEAMDTTVGSVSLDNGVGALSGSWNNPTNTIYTASYSGLAYSTQYTITVEDFEDLAGNPIFPNPDTSHSFTTKAQPTGPDVSSTMLNLDLNGNPTGTLTISLGQSGNQAATAGVTVAPANTGDISVDTASLNADGSVTVTGHRVVSGASLTVGFSGGDLATPTSIPVTVNVTDFTPQSIYHTVTFDLAGGIHTGGGTLTQTVPDDDAATAPTASRSGYTFNGWDKPFNNVTADMTVTAQWSYNVNNNNNDSGGGSSYTSPAITTAAPILHWIDRAEAQGFIRSGQDYARSRRAGQTGIRRDALAALSGYEYQHDTLDAGAVAVRVYIPKPELTKNDLMVSGYVKGDVVDLVQKHFEKWFSNKLRVIHFDQTAQWGQPVHIAAKVDLTGMDTKNLYIYAYDKTANAYKRIEKPAYWIDSNGYLHFTTESAGEIIISDGLLERK